MHRSPTSSAEEAAAIAAAIERFRADTAPVEAPEPEEATSPWQRVALVEGVGAKGTVQHHLSGGVEWLS